MDYVEIKALYSRRRYLLEQIGNEALMQRFMYPTEEHAS
jgi:hypothetical protein